jgi:hypothetical protein
MVLLLAEGPADVRESYMRAFCNVNFHETVVVSTD